MQEHDIEGKWINLENAGACDLGQNEYDQKMQEHAIEGKWINLENAGACDLGQNE